MHERGGSKRARIPPKCWFLCFIGAVAPFAFWTPYSVHVQRSSEPLQEWWPAPVEQARAKRPVTKVVTPPNAAEATDDSYGDGEDSPAAVLKSELGAALPPAEKCKLFTLWEYRNRAPLFARLNLQSWIRHSHGLCDEPILINDTNVRQWIPDMPEEYFRIEYDAAKSDMIRYALLYHNGGIYMDADFIVTRDFRDLITRLQSYDLVTYEVEGQNCKSGTFSSNFMGGRKGSVVHKAVWEAQKAAVTKHCKRNEMKLEKVCCLDDPRVLCHVPWTQLGEGISHLVLRRLLQKDRAAKRLNVFCFRKGESFVPRDMGFIFEKLPALRDAEEHWKQIREVNPMGRIAYHLFNSNSGVSQMNRETLFDSDTVVGALYTMAFAEASETDSDAAAPSSAQLLVADAPQGLAERFAQALRPSYSPRDCRGLLGVGSSGEVDLRDGGPVWCRNIGEAAVEEEGHDAKAFAWTTTLRDPRPAGWEQATDIAVELHTCGPSSVGGLGAGKAGGDPPFGGDELCSGLRKDALAAGISSVAVAEAATRLSQFLAGRGPRGTFVSLALRGQEWLALGCVAPADLRKIELLDLRTQFCSKLPVGKQAHFAALERRLRVLERLGAVFGILVPASLDATGGLGAVADASGKGAMSALLCGAASASSKGGGADAAAALLYVNSERLRDVRRKGSQLADRIDQAMKPTVTAEACAGIDDAGSSGDGALHAWCLRVLEGAKATGTLVGLSYGIDTWDAFSRHLSDVYRVPSVLYDCFATPSNSGETPSLENYKVAYERRDVCIDGPTNQDNDGRVFERLTDHLRQRPKRGTIVKIDVEGYEWDVLNDTLDEDLRRIDLFDLQVYFCNRLPNEVPELQELERRVRILERLLEIFAVVAHAPSDPAKFRGQMDRSICSHSGEYPDTISISFVNRARLEAATDTTP